MPGALVCTSVNFSVLSGFISMSIYCLIIKGKLKEKNNFLQQKLISRRTCEIWTLLCYSVKIWTMVLSLDGEIVLWVKFHFYFLMPSPIFQNFYKEHVWIWERKENIGEMKSAELTLVLNVASLLVDICKNVAFPSMSHQLILRVRIATLRCKSLV